MSKSSIRGIFEEVRDAILGDRAEDTPGADTVPPTDEPGGWGENAAKSTAERFNRALPYIRRAGYTVTEIEVAMGLSPAFTAHLRMDEAISDEEKDALLAETSKKTLIHTVLKALFRATNARKMLQFSDFYFAEIELELSILPTAILKFHPKDGGTETVEVAIPED